ncbi:hypothetical protein [Mycoplasma phocoenae]|uniref:Transmembrane protein n=1 Tax=Mycoplasma phocoenae TaxID=754517 RepID=A0A858U3H8_9MOLU|nr:hypothetical protein [Mycoplasma phocoenae]QJG66972.1 hypothetical protein HGG69_01380 [Mycoplasma phocoenae]
MNPFEEQNISSKEELMKNDKHKYRPFFIWYGVILSIFLLMTLATVITTLCLMNYYKEFIDQWIQSKSNNNIDTTEFSNTNSYMIWSLLFKSIIFLIISASMLITYITGMKRAMITKDYARFNLGHFRYIVMVVIFFVFTTSQKLITMKETIVPLSKDINTILILASTIFILIGHFTVGNKCKAIVKTFIRIDVLEKQRKLQEMIMKNQGQNPMFPMFPFITPNTESVNNQQNTTQTNQSSEVFTYNPEEENASAEDKEIINSKYYQVMKEFDRPKLISMAEKLNIYGADELNDMQLRIKIARIYLAAESKGEENVQ